MVAKHEREYGSSARDDYDAFRALPVCIKFNLDRMNFVESNIID